MKKSLVKTLKAFEKYIEGGSVAELLLHMQNYDNLDRLNRHFRKPYITSEENAVLTEEEKKLLQTLKDLLHKLNIDDTEFPFKDNIYDFLAAISREGHQQTAFILNLINEKDFFNKIKITFLGGGAITTLVFGFIYLVAFEEILGIVLSLQASLLLIPFLGLIFTSIAALYQFIENQSDATLSAYTKKKNNIFLGINALVGILGYLLILFSASTFFITTSLLILGALINVVKDIFDLINYDKIYYSGSIDLSEEKDPLIHKAFYRSQFNYEKKRNDIIIGLAASLLLMSIVILWCCLPVGIYTTVSIMTLKGLVYLSKMIFQKLNEINERNRLQEKLSEVDSNKALIRCSQDSNLSEIPSIKVDKDPEPSIVFNNTDLQLLKTPTKPAKLKRELYRTTTIKDGMGIMFATPQKQKIENNTEEKSDNIQDEHPEEPKTADSLPSDSRSFSAVFNKRLSLFAPKNPMDNDLDIPSTPISTPAPTGGH